MSNKLKKALKVLFADSKKSVMAGGETGMQTVDKPMPGVANMKTDKTKKKRPLFDAHINQIKSVLENANKRTGKEKLQKSMVYKDYMGSCLGRSRDSMPQVDDKHLDDFIMHFSDKVGNTTKGVKKVNIKLSQIKPTQSDINEDKVKGMIKDGYKWNDRKYIISKDNYLVDGHHGWAAGLESDPETEVSAYKVNLPIKDLLKRSNLLKITRKRDIDDNEIKKAIEYAKNADTETLYHYFENNRDEPGLEEYVQIAKAEILKRYQ